MTAVFQKIRARWWSAAVGMGLVALAGLRISAWATPRPLANPLGIRYICIGDLAVDMTGRQVSDMSKELGLDSPEQRARNACRLPHVPQVQGARFLAAAATPSTGLGAMVLEIDSPRDEALERALAGLEGAGWFESDASALMGKRNPDRALVGLERQGEWLWVVAVPKKRDQNRSTIFLAGRFAAQLRRTKR